MKRSSLFALFLSVVPSICRAADAPAPVPATGPELMKIETLPWRETQWHQVPVRTLEDLPGYNVAQVDGGLSRYGGLLSKKATATGFFHAQKVNGRWWLVDPDGYLFIDKAVNAVGPQGTPNAEAALAKKFGDETAWAAQTTHWLKELGFNGSGSWSADDLLRLSPERLAGTPNWSFMGSYKGTRPKTTDKAGKSGYPNDAIPVFDPAFSAYCEKRAQQLVATKDDPWLLGHFSDNELPFPKNELDNYLTLVDTDPGYKAAWEWLRAKHGPDAKITDATDADREQFVAYVGDKYFSIVGGAIKKADPNHMYLGTRFHSNVMNQPLFMQTAGKYLDVVSINLYGTWTPKPERMEQWATNAGKPFLITEFYTKGEDSGMANTGGAGWLVHTQRDRGLFYEQFTLGLLESKNCVGWHWFKYTDNDPTDLKADPSNRDSNKGLVSATYEIYAPLVEEMKRDNLRTYSLADYFDEVKVSMGSNGR